MKRVAVILAGCGFKDGGEIYEATCALLALDEAGAQVQCFAPNVPQHDVINHLTGETMAESRNVLVEAARLARGQVKDLILARVEDFDALVIPGGFGAAKNLCDFALKGSQMQVQPDVLAFAQGMHRAGKPIGLICIAPALAPIIAGPGTRYTIGHDTDTATAINAMGGEHVNCAVDDILVDAERKLVTTPAYMLATRISQTAAGVRKLVQAVLAMT